MHTAFVLAAVHAAAEEPGHSILLPELPDLIWGTVAFVVVLVVIIRLVLPNINKALDARRDAIEGGIQRAEKAQAEAQANKEQFEEALKEARTEAAAIREQARADGVRILGELKEQAQAEVARINAAALATIEVERQNALNSLRSEVGTLALSLASGVIGASLEDDKKSAAIVDRFLADLEADSSTKAGK
ncbi:MAG: F0F1 ATP synthase subunit B [Cryobacterium sp.]|jgi:F-type H+-transporting ATPase subunit b|nr:F0F1 ATP synthase subunit B [Cryobacterium sp.]